MNFPIYASIALFVFFFAIMLSVRLFVDNNRERRMKDAYFAREAKANATRKKSLDSLAYITIPQHLLDTTSNSLSPDISYQMSQLVELSNQPIVNLLGMTNTDLKLAYGVPNLPLLTDYDTRYTRLARTLNQIGTLHYEEGNIDLAKAFLTFAVETGSDIRATYQILASIYQEEGNTAGFSFLSNHAKKLPGLSQTLIGQTLQEFGLCID